MAKNNITRTVRRWTHKNSVIIFILLAILIIWEVYSRYFNTRGNLYFPSIEFTVRQTVEFHELVINGLFITLTEIIFGYLLAVLLGVTLGILLSKSFTFRQASLPTIIYVYSLPAAILAPLFVIWFDSYYMAAIAFVGWTAFFSVFISTITGFSEVDQEFYHMGDLFGATPWQMTRNIEFWEALPHIKSGMKISVQQAIVGAIVIEFIASTGGLGYILVRSISLLRPGLMFGTLIIIIAFSIIFYKLIIFSVDRLAPKSLS